MTDGLFYSLGDWVLTFFRGFYYRGQYERTIRLNHELKRQAISLKLERDHWEQRFISATENK